VRGLLDRHHRVLRDALRAALVAAARDGQLAPGCPPELTADMLTLLAYGVNLRSRAGADAAELTATVSAALERIAAGPAG
jgi:TetR/AcrR family transcriptional regulator, transcriptional repressor for nem operon